MAFKYLITTKLRGKAMVPLSASQFPLQGGITDAYMVVKLPGGIAIC